ncbi:MAG: tRNA preQ1(34) S-adenosylmethionine ribosyltransferase-isomerase QueA [Spirochaetales bacterium]|nr:tRNA preQ1(34) S-adenosylmethionine ribosyltransferase-isomerase QueA [Spirochaetales bacterium]
MLTEEYNFEVPEYLIAQHPAKHRSDSRMLVYYRDSKKIEDRMFRELPEIINSKYHLVFNNSRVICSRLAVTKESTGHKGELLILKLEDENHAIALTDKSKKYRTGEKIILPSENNERIVCVVEEEIDSLKKRLFCERPIFTVEYLNKYGAIPLPPYIKKSADDDDKIRYQTIYSKPYGSAAAPTAGLHFDEELFLRLKSAGVNYTYVTLHVGLGTFQPIYSDTIEEHKIHQEEYEITEDEACKLNEAVAAGKILLPVGTTSLRTIESNFDNGKFTAGHFATQLYITPGYKLKSAGALFTNFHTPKSSLAVLVSAITGYKEFTQIYTHAVKEEYRFFSYGDCMLIL